MTPKPLLLIWLLLLPAAATAQETATAHLIDGDGQDVGRVELRQTPHSGVLISVRVEGLAEGVHAFHVHASGRCDVPDFQSAGGHFNPAEREHGFHVPEGPHAGDLPNIHVPASGTLEVELVAPRLSLRSTHPGFLLDDDGSAIMVHAGADDYESAPSGDAGSRVACGVVQMTGR